MPAIISFPMSPTAWTVLFAIAVGMAALGTEYRDRPIFAAPEHWTNHVATAVRWTGRTLVIALVVIVVGGAVVG